MDATCSGWDMHFKGLHKNVCFVLVGGGGPWTRWKGQPCSPVNCNDASWNLFVVYKPSPEFVLLLYVI